MSRVVAAGGPGGHRPGAVGAGGGDAGVPWVTGFDPCPRSHSLPGSELVSHSAGVRGCICFIGFRVEMYVRLPNLTYPPRICQSSNTFLAKCALCWRCVCTDSAAVACTHSHLQTQLVHNQSYANTHTHA
jgi:hypothetical protein